MIYDVIYSLVGSKNSCKTFIVSLNGKSEHHHRILYIRIYLSTKFQLELTILIFRTKFPQKGCFPSKTENVDTPIEIYIFKLISLDR